MPVATSSAPDRPIHRYSAIDGSSALCGQRVLSAKRPVPAARDTDEMVVPCRIGAVETPRLPAVRASPTIRVARRHYSARSPDQLALRTGPIVNARIHFRDFHWRSAFEPATGRAPNRRHDHHAVGGGWEGQRFRSDTERAGHSTSSAWAFSGGTARQTRRRRAEPRGKREQLTVARLRVDGRANAVFMHHY
jgi:hypothetical protein